MEETNQDQYNQNFKEPINIWLVVIIAVIITAFIVGGGVYFWQQSVRQAMVNENNSNNNLLQNEIDSLKIQLMESEEEQTNNQLPESSDSNQQSNTTSVDSTWDLYTNNTLGFSIKIPKTVSNINTLDKIEVIESDNVVYLTYKSDYNYTKILSRSQSNLSDIDKTKGIPWAILVKQVKSDNELDQFIKSRYGRTCGLGNKTLSKQEGVYDVSIDFTNWTPGDESGCFVNYLVKIKYSPKLGKVAAWDLGQGDTFLNYDANNKINTYTVFDNEMSDSFQFIK